MPWLCCSFCLRSAAIDFTTRVPAATVEFAARSLAPENGYSDAGALTAPSSAPSFDIAKNFLRSERAMYRLSDAEIDSLELLGESVSPSGLRMLRVRQVVNGRPVFLSETRILLDAEGRILRTLGAPVAAWSMLQDTCNRVRPIRRDKSATGRRQKICRTKKGQPACIQEARRRLRTDP